MGYSFGDSLVNFSQFLAKNGYPEKVVWLTTRDVLLSGRFLIYVKVPAPDSNEEGVRRLFDSGASERAGILLQAIGEMNGSSLAYAWSPRDASEAERHLMPNGVKMSAHLEKIPARAVRSRVRWYWLCMRLRRKQGEKNQLLRKGRT